MPTPPEEGAERGRRRAQEAEQAFRNAARVSEADPAVRWRLSDVYRQIGLILWEQDRLPEALPYMARALELNERSAWANIHYGKVLYLVDPTQADRAAHFFAVALSLDPRPDIWRNLIEFWAWVKEPERQAALCAQSRQAGVELGNLKECE